MYHYFQCSNIISNSNGLPHFSSHGADINLGLNERMRRRYFHRQLPSLYSSWVFIFFQSSFPFQKEAPWEGDTKLSQIPKFSSALVGIFPLPVSSPCATPRRPRHFEYHFHPPTFHHGDLGLQRTRRGRHCSAEFPSFAFTTPTQRLFSRNHLLLTLAITPERLA